MTKDPERHFFVAGGTGLLGSAIVRQLDSRKENWQASYCSTAPCFTPERFRRFDLRDFDQALEAARGITDLILCAGVTSGLKGMSDRPSAVILPNLQIAGNMLEAARLNGVKRTVFVSSATVYPPSETALREEDLDLNVRPFDLYLAVGSVNRYLEDLCYFYYKKFGLAIGIVRPSNLYGPGDHFEEDRSHVLPALIRRAVNREMPFKVWGDGSAVRDFIYVEDAAEGVLKVLESYAVCDPVNLGSGTGYSIREAVDLILEVCGHSVKPEYEKAPAHAVNHRVLDMSRYETRVGSLRKTTLKDGIMKTVAWYLETQKKSNTPRVHASPKPLTFLTSGAKSGLGKFLFETFGGAGFGREDAPEAIRKAKQEGVDVILHCAFNRGKKFSNGRLDTYLEDNLFLTQTLLEIPHRKFIYLSSIDVYPAAGGCHTEEEAIDPNRMKSLYALMKLFSEQLIEKKAFEPLILRCSAFLGPYVQKNNLNLLLEQDSPQLSLTQNSVLNFIRYQDVAGFIERATERHLSGIYNLVSRENIRLSDIAQYLKKTPRYGAYCYDAGGISNKKAAAVWPAFNGTSLEILTDYRALKAGQKGIYAG